MEGKMFVTAVNKEESINSFAENKFLSDSCDASVSAHDSNRKF
jgi:hypothetical protein